jgi:hypothetical protein
MKKYWLIFGILGVLALVVYLTQSSTTLNRKDARLSYADTSSVNCLKIIDGGDTLIVIRSKNSWYTGKYAVRPSAIRMALSAIASFNVSSPLSSNERSLVNLQLKKGVLIEAYKNDKLLKSWQMSDDSITRRTFLKRTDASKAYAVEIPGFSGRIKSIFSTTVSRWRDNKLLPVAVQDLRSVQVLFPSKTKGYTIKSTGEKISLLNADQKNISFDVAMVSGFLTSLSQLRFEGVVKQLSGEKKQWLSAQTPKVEWKIATINSKIIDVQVFPIPVEEGKMQYDMNKAYLKIDNDTTLLIVKYKDIDPLMVDVESFKR